MPADSAVGILEQLRDHRVDGCVGGGWAVDALLGRQTREHADLDLWLTSVFPASALDGRGTIAGQLVRCDAAEWVVRWRNDYPPRTVDRHDVALICQHFGLALPPAYR